MSVALNWMAGGAAARPGAREDTRYAFARSLHPGAAMIAVTSPLLATLIVLSVAFLPA